MTVSTAHSEFLVVAPLAVGPTLVTHVLSVKKDLTGSALEAPDVVLLVQGHQSLAVPQEAAAASAPVPRLWLSIAGHVDSITVNTGLVQAWAGTGGACHIGQGAPHLLLLIRLLEPHVHRLLCLDTFLTQTVFTSERNPLSGWEWVL